MSALVARKKSFFYGYIVVVASVAILIVSGGIFNTFGIFVTPLQSEFGWSRAAISAASSLGLFVYGLSGIFMGELADRFGPRSVTVFCGILVGLGCLMMARLDSLWQLYVSWGIIVGVGHSTTDVVLLSTVARWFARRRGAMSGFVKTGTGIGILVVSLLEAYLIATQGWRTALIVLGVAAFVFVVPLSQLLRRDPTRMGQQQDGDRQDDAPVSKLPELGLALKQAARTGQFWIICAVYLVILVCTQSIMVHIVPHATDIGISPASAAAILSAIGASSIVGRVAMGGAGDRFGNKRVMIAGFLILIVSLAWLLQARQLWALWIFAIVYGFSHGGLFSIPSPLVAEVFGTRSQGVIYGIVTFSGTVGGFVGPIVTGYMFDVSGSYQTPFILALGVSVIGLLLIAMLRPLAKPGKLEASRNTQPG